MERIYGHNTTFWVTPIETRKTKVDIFQDIWCKPCLKKIRAEPCGQQTVAYLACMEYDFKPLSEDSSLTPRDVCGVELKNVDNCMMENFEYYEKYLAPRFTE